MRSAPRISVGTQLTVAILLVIALSWVLSSGTSSYIAYQRARTLRQQMLSRPDLYPVPIPEPKFGIVDFLLGRPPELGPPPRAERRLPQMNVASGQRQALPQGPRPGQPPAGPPPQAGMEPGRTLIARVVIVFLLAVLAGKWMSGRFSSRLEDLASGAGAFDSGNFSHRIAESGNDEFARVASAMNQMADRVSKQIAALEDDAERRRQFLADVAHELRSPVATIRTMAGAMQDGVADDPVRRERAVGSLVRSSERLLNLVTDLLELAKLDLRELPINPRRVDLRGLVAAAVDTQTAAAANACITLHPLEPGAPVIANVDPDRLMQVLDNLLNNAISYAGQGAQVQVTVETGDQIKITIADTGVGISPDHLPHVFDSFYRVNTARTPSEGHSGLGLRISRGLVEAHGGQLTLTSTESNGTTAVITLPV